MERNNDNLDWVGDRFYGFGYSSVIMKDRLVEESLYNFFGEQWGEVLILSRFADVAKVELEIFTAVPGVGLDFVDEIRPCSFVYVEFE